MSSKNFIKDRETESSTNISSGVLSPGPEAPGTNEGPAISDEGFLSYKPSEVNFGKGTNKNTILKETRTSTLHQHRIQFSTDTHDLHQYVLVQ